MFGRAAALTTGELTKPGESQPELPANAGQETIARLDKMRYSNGEFSTAKIRLEM